jgi:Ca2+-transporting ATPase
LKSPLSLPSITLSQDPDLVDSTSWSDNSDTLLIRFAVDISTGLSDQEVLKRQKRCGLNQLREIKPRTLLSIFFNQIKSFVVLLLFAASIVSFSFGELIQGFAVFVVIVINTLIGFFTELRAIRSMEALRKLGEMSATVRRNSQVTQILAQDMVPGDIVLFESGDVISADIRLLAASNLQADESVLTGESIPVSKNTGSLGKEIHLSERTNMLHKGTAITRGSGEGLVTGTGFNTQLGQVAKLISTAERKNTPLENKLADLARQLVYFTVGIVTLIAIAGIAVGRELHLAIEIAIALAVAAIPEGLPIVATIALATGLHKMSKRHALINRLSAVETLGATGVIITDKTGTLTENRMTLSRIELEGLSVEVSGTGLDIKGSLHDQSGKPISHTAVVDELLKVVVLCNNAALNINPDGKMDIVGDPTEVALLIAGAKRDILRGRLLQTCPELREEAFSSDTKAMATFHQQHDSQEFFVAVKGAPETILAACDQLHTDVGMSDFSREQKKHWLAKANTLAAQGLRILAVAKKQATSLDEAPYENLIFLGLLGLVDPPRPGVKEAIQQCHLAGIRVVMVTGDHPATAFRVGEKLGITAADADLSNVLDLREWSEDEDLSLQPALLKTSIFARATPRQKQQLIQLHQAQNRIVAMTGDGINDAPALKLADIGIAMGLRGTQVAKEASDMILQDDEFSSIVVAIKQGRVIYNNILKFVVYLLSCNLSEILIITVATIVNAPLPLLPLQILFLNLVTDVFPALALGVSGGSAKILDQAPRLPGTKFLSSQQWILIVAYSALMSVIVLAAMFISITYLQYSVSQAVTVAFLSLAFAQLWHVFNMREDSTQWFRNEVTANRWIWFALILCSGLIMAAVYVPSLSSVLQLSPPDLNGWLLIMAMSVFVLVIGPLIRAIVTLLPHKLL